MKIRQVVTVSCETPEFPAQNLLTGEGPWTCPAGTSTASVELELDECAEIENIVVGNYGASLVEVLVANPAAHLPYKVSIHSILSL